MSKIKEMIEVRNQLNSWATCSSGAIEYSFELNVNNNYKPQMNVWLMFCQNNVGQYVIDSIVDITFNRNYQGTVRDFQGTTHAKALNAGKTLYYRAEGNWYRNSSTSIEGEFGLNTKYVTVNFKVSNTRNYYGYSYDAGNYYLFSD